MNCNLLYKTPNCNLLYKTPSFIPVVIHNLRGFDGHLIAQSLGKFDGMINCIPQNLEKYPSFSFQNLRFIDSLQFLSASLDALVEDLKMDTENLEYNFRHFFRILTREKTRKVYFKRMCILTIIWTARQSLKKLVCLRSIVFIRQ